VKEKSNHPQGSDPRTGRISEHYEKYKEKTASKPPKPVNRERERQNALSAQKGLADAPKDFDWLDKNIPCQAACPAHTDIPGYLDAIARGDFDAAYRINLEDNIFPAVLGRVCTRPCEPACRHGWEGLGEPVAICFSKRSAADFQVKKAPVVVKALFPASGKTVAIIGAGVAGLAAGRELARCGHRVTVYEKHTKPGGMMLQGIPHFRLPREVVDREIEQVRLAGVEIRCNQEVGRDVALLQLFETHDAVIMASGTMKPNESTVPGSGLQGVRHGLEFLLEANESGSAQVGRHVVVIGGGFTAVDCARTAQRLGAESVRMCYRRSESEMYITPGEVEEMRHEGIAFDTMVAPVEYRGADGRVTAVKLRNTELGTAERDGRRSFREIPGSEFEIAADTVLLGIGQSPDLSWVNVIPGAASSTKLFRAGDVATGAKSLIDAIAHGKACARQVDEFLMGRERLKDVAFVEDASGTGRTREMDAIPRQPMPVLPLAGRSLRSEVESGFAPAASETEAKRCYLCHFKYEIDNDLCIYCDRCLKVKPVENCIVKVSSLIYDEDGRITGFNRSQGSKDYNMLYIDQAQCIRCGACKDVCPVECISLQKVSRKTTCSP
jgi:NADPH-dependent glutamate synthase beta subunit-like oxidoreductase/ferredoxin